MNPELYDSIIRVFKETGSVLETAHRLDTYPIKVRRVLITEELWSSKRSREIDKLLKEGKRVTEIAKMLGKDEKSVQAYMRYTGREYGNPEKSSGAINVANYRNRNSKITEKQHKNIIGSGYNPDAKPMTHKKKSIMKLHLELEIDEQCLPILKKYGKAGRGISRDILVPSDMTLQALHYMIQKAFGLIEWSPHNFELDFNEFFKLINNSASRWSSFCGLYFRFPIGGDCYPENEEYKGDISYKNWLKKQYTGPYRYCRTEEHFSESRKLIDQCIKDNPFFEDIVFDVENEKCLISGTGEECPDLIMADSTEGFSWQHINELLERLSVGEVLYPNGSSRDEAAIEKLMGLKWSSTENDPEVVPITDSIYYRYWTKWIIRITCTGQYNIRTGVPGFEDKMGRLLKAPLCICYDGLPVVDEVNDIGYCRFLEELHSTENWKRENAKEWAREMGWTGYMVKPENLV